MFWFTQVKDKVFKPSKALNDFQFGKCSLLVFYGTVFPRHLNLKAWAVLLRTLWLLLVLFFDFCTRVQDRKCVRIVDLFFWQKFIHCSLPVPSRLALGVEDRRIPDGGFSASSSWDRNHGPKRARLNIPRQGRLTGAWCTRPNNRVQWLLVDITKPARVVGFAVQGRQDYGQWVTSLKISYSKDGIYFRYYTERRRPKVCFTLIYLMPC